MSTNPQLVELTAQFLEAERSAWAEHTTAGEKADRLFDVLDNLHKQLTGMMQRMGIDKMPEVEAKALIAKQAEQRKLALARKKAEADRIAALVARAKAAA